MYASSKLSAELRLWVSAKDGGPRAAALAGVVMGGKTDPKTPGKRGHRPCPCRGDPLTERCAPCFFCCNCCCSLCCCCCCSAKERGLLHDLEEIILVYETVPVLVKLLCREGEKGMREE